MITIDVFLAVAINGDTIHLGECETDSRGAVDADTLTMAIADAPIDCEFRAGDTIELVAREEA